MSGRRRKRVGPSEDVITKVEIRPSRILRIQHFNPRRRDEKFENEMQMYVHYKQKGIPPSGPLAMPRRQQSNIQKKAEDSKNTKQSHPHTVPEDKTKGVDEYKNHENSGDVSQGAQGIIPEDSVPTDYQEETKASSVSSSALSSPNKGVTENVRSASSVLLALHNQKQFQQKQQQLKSQQLHQPQSPHSEVTIAKKDSEVSTSMVKSGKENKGLKLDLTQDDFVDDNNTPCKSPSPMNPPSAETRRNDAFLTDLTPKQQINNGDSKVKLISTTSEASHSSAIDKDMVIFFIHGVGGSSNIWNAQIQHFSSLGYEVVVPDLIGHGFSSTPKDSKAYHFKEIAADLEALFDMHCKRRNVLIGHSYGASFATLLARNRPRHITRLVLISGGPPTPLAPQPGVFTLPYCMLACIKPCLTCGFQRGAFHSKRVPSIPKKEAFNIPAYVLQHTMNGQDWADGDEIFHNWLTCPCLLIYGEEDQFVSLSEEEDMARVIFDSRLEVIKDASHMVMVEAPEEVNQLIAHFIRQPTDLLRRQSYNNNASGSRSQIPPLTERSKSRRSLKSAKSQRSLHHHLSKIAKN